MSDVAALPPEGDEVAEAAEEKQDRADRQAGDGQEQPCEEARAAKLEPPDLAVLLEQIVVLAQQLDLAFAGVGLVFFLQLGDRAIPLLVEHGRPGFA